MKVDAPLLAPHLADAGPAARRLEELGYAGAFSFEGPHDPFFPLLLAAQQTERLELSTAVAIAFARSPMLLANLGYDLQALSQGRFILGLGSQIRPHIEKRFSMPWSKPAARMRELVQAIRTIWRSWNEGQRLEFRGEFYRHTLMTPFFNPGPNPYGNPRIFLAGVGPRMTEVAGEVADGFFTHPFNTPESVRDVTLPALESGLARAGRVRAELEISFQVMVVSGSRDEEIERARTAIRAQIAFYASTPAYRVVLESRGWGDLQPELNRLSKSTACIRPWRHGSSLKREFTHADFADLSWHDNEIYGIEFRVGDAEKDDWTSDLALDIDYIVDWIRKGDAMQFSIAPATLVFHGVTDLRLEIDGGQVGQQVSLLLPSIAAIERERIVDQRVFLDRPYYRWCIRLNGSPNGELAFGAVGFTQTLRREPVLCEQQRLGRSLRGAG
jgi:probable F420-dependent oxidoreductase